MGVFTASSTIWHSHMRYSTWPAILVLVASMGCASRTKEPPTPAALFAANSNRGPCALAPVDTTGWRRVRLAKAPMSLLLPPDYERDSVIFIGGSTGWPAPEEFSRSAHGPSITISHIVPYGPWPARLPPSEHWCLMRTGDHTVFLFSMRSRGWPASRREFISQAMWWLDEHYWLEISGSARDSLELREMLTIIRAARIQQAPGS